jgi:hypothetical protein
MNELDGNWCPDHVSSVPSCSHATQFIGSIGAWASVLLASSDWAPFQDDSNSGAYFMIVRSSEKKYSLFFGS